MARATKVASFAADAPKSSPLMKMAALPDIDTLLDVDRVYRGVLELLAGASPESA